VLRGGRVLATGALGETMTDAVLSDAYGVALHAVHDGGRWSARLA
jgi:ABC-type cobalamin/Fe3+-siderophores transport system ATPase subunit